MNKKILFLDLDGTLLNDDKQIPEENKRALHRAVAQGHRVVIATGRALSSARALMEQLDFDREGFFCIAYNGGISLRLRRKKDPFRTYTDHGTGQIYIRGSEEEGTFLSDLQRAGYSGAPGV